MSAPVVIPIPGFISWGYLIVGDTLALVDPGARCVWERALVEARRVLGPQPPPITLLTATHWHVDHIGGLFHAQRESGGAVALSRRIAYHLKDGGRIAYPPWRRFYGMIANRVDMEFQKPDRWSNVFGMAPVGLPFQTGRSYRGPVDRWFSDGETLPGHPGWCVIEAPGHTIDSVCFWHEATGTLISGDDFLGGRQGAFVNRFIVSEEVMRPTTERLARLPVRRLMPGHGRLIDGENLLAGLRV